MSFRRSRVDISHYSKTKSITVLIEYIGDLEVDNPPVAKESMMLLLGDTWHDYAQDLGLDPLETMASIVAHAKNDRRTP